MAITATRASFTLFAFLLFIAVSSAKPIPKGFTLNLIQSDSPKSPLYHPNYSDFTQVQTVISRSIARAKWISTVALGLVSKSSNFEAEMIYYSGQYLMNISIGTPPFSILALADTGSDHLIWTQCEPYKQKAQFFHRNKSLTYKPVSCPSPQCTSHKSSSKFSHNCVDSKCYYEIMYADWSTSRGAIATETLTLGSSSSESVKFQNIRFGCSFSQQRMFSAPGSGIIGLGNGRDSLIGQLEKSIGGKFSYCFVPLFGKQTKSGVINFGSNAIVSGEGVVSTPLVAKDPPTFYYLTLKAITIGKKRIKFTSRWSFWVKKGNIIIDSGTTLLKLPKHFYKSVVAEIVKQVDIKPVYDSSVKLDLCYFAKDFKAPEIVVNLDGADVKLNKYNAWIEAGHLLCFAAVPSKVAVYGNRAQVNFLVGYDKEGKKVSFKPADCAEHN